MHWKPIVAPTSVVFLALLAGTLLYLFKPQAEKRPVAQPPVLEVSVQRLTLQDFQPVFNSQGKVEAKNRVQLAAQVSGIIVDRHDQFQRGGYFRQGELLVQIDDGDYKAALLSAQADLSHAQHRLSEAKAQSAVAVADWKRQGRTSEPSDFVARRTQVVSAEAALKAAEAVAVKAHLDLDRTAIIAPFDGYVIGEMPGVGNYMTPGKVLGTIVAADQLKVVLPLSARWRDLLAFSPGAINDIDSLRKAVEIRLPDLEKGSWKARLRGLEAQLDEKSRQMMLVADIDVQSGSHAGVELLIGDFVHAKITGRQLSGVYVIPRSALHNGSYIWSVHDHKLYKRHIDVVWSDKQWTVIDQGVDNGELVVTSHVGSALSGTQVHMTLVKEDGSSQLVYSP